MAEDSSVQTQQAVSFEVGDDRRLDLSEVKRLDTYSKAELPQLKALFTELLAALNTTPTGYYELYENRKITQAKLVNRGATTLTTSVAFPADIQQDTENTLFYIDWVALLLDAAEQLQKLHPNERLAYLEAQDTEAWLKDWGEASGEAVSQWALQKQNLDAVIGLLFNLSATFDELEEDRTLEKDAETEKESGDLEPSDELKEYLQESAKRVTDTAKVVAPATGTAAAATTPQQVSVDRSDIEVQRTIATEVNWVFNAARVNLLQQFFDAAGIDQNNLPADLLAQLTRLEDSLRNELFRITDGLSDTQLSQLLSHNFRINLYRQLLQNLLANPENLFYTDLLSFYKEFTKQVAKAVPTSEQEVVFNRIDAALKETVGNTHNGAVLQQIHEEVQAWIAELRTQYQAEALQDDAESQEEKPVLAEEPSLEELVTQADTPLIHSVPPAKNAFSSTQQSQLASSFDTAVSLPAAERQALQNQSARLVWGAATELFGDASNIPPQLIDQISGHAVTYLLSQLSAEELTQLAKSPSSLLRHIKALALEVQKDLRFQQAAQQFASINETPKVSKSEIIQREIDVGYAVLIDELFYERGVTESQVAQDKALKNEFEGIKKFIREELYTELSQLSLTELQQLLANPQSQDAFLDRFESELIKGNPQLVHILRTFLNKYARYLVSTGQVSDAQSVESILLDYSGDLEQQEPPAAIRERKQRETTQDAEREQPIRQVLQSGQPRQSTTQESGPSLIETTPQSVKKKKDLLNNLLQAQWNQLKPEEKLAIYVTYDYPVPKKFRQPNPDLQQFNAYFVLVPEFLETNPKKIELFVHNLKYPPQATGEYNLDPTLKDTTIEAVVREKEISEHALETQPHVLVVPVG